MSAEPAPDDHVLTTAQVAEWAQLPLSAVRHAIREGHLRASLPAGRRNGYRIRRSDLERWLDTFSPYSSGERDA